MILACPSCDSRYDVTGYEVGQRFRCRCGTVTALEKPSEQAGLLACPWCGAGVAPNARQCAHCSHELLLKSCPRCLSRVFHGHKHCPECGSTLDRAAAGELRADAPCPRCEQALHARLVGDLVIDECTACGGVFLDRTAVERVISDRRQARADALLGVLGKPEVKPQAGRLYVKCPTCAKLMNRRQFALGAGIVVDVCRDHGTFFDAGELPRIIEFVMQGGLEQAEKAEIERLRATARREMQAAMAASNDPNGAGGRSLSMIPPSSGSAVVDFLVSLLR